MRKIPFFDLAPVHGPLEADLTTAFQRVLADGRYIMGPDLGALETEFAAYVGVEHAVGVSSGTDALLATLMALGVGPGDDVIVPTMTFFATAGAVARLGARPIFADVDEDTLLLDPEDVLARRTEATRAIIPVHLFGQCAPLDAYREADLVVIEDAAQCHGATDASGRRAGGLGDAGCFSFFPTKPLGGFGDGGIVTTDSDDLAARVRLMRTHGARPKFHHITVGGNFRLDALQAALIRVKLPLLDVWGDERRHLAACYRERLEPVVESGDLRLLAEVSGRHVYHQHVVRATRRTALVGALGAEGIGTAIYYPEPLHVQPCFEALGQPAGSLPRSEAACEEVLALPCYPGLRVSHVDRICEVIRQFYGR